MIRFRHLLVALASVAVPAAGPCGVPVAFAQEPVGCAAAAEGQQAPLFGAVSDSSGARVPGATVIAECGPLTRETRTAGDGTYSLRLPPGRYQVRIEKTGFAIWTAELTVSTTARVELNATLTVGQVEDRVTVAASTPATVASVASKVPVPVRRIPQSITVITRERMDDQNLTSVAAALDQMIGVQTIQGQVGGNSTGANSVRIRGWYGGATQIEGFPSGTVDRYLSAIDTAVYERVEVLRGANGLFGGGSNLANPGGTINVALKRPLDRFTVQGESTIGSWNSYRVVGDVTGPLVSSGKVRGRAVIAFHDRDYFYDVAHERRSVVYGTVEVDLTDNTLLTLGSSYQRAGATPSPGLPTYTTGLIDLPRHTSLAVDWGEQDGWRTDTFAKLAWRLRQGWSLNLSGLHLKEDTYRNDGWVCSRTVDPLTNLADVCHYWSRFNRHSVSLDPHVTGSFTVWGLPQHVTFGTNYLTQWSHENEGGDDLIGKQNIFAPDPNGIPRPPERIDSSYERDTSQYGLYGQTRMQPLRALAVVGGGRLSSWSSDNQPSVPATAARTKYERTNILTPYAGAMFDVTRTISVYGSYTDVFRPHDRRAFDGEFLPPVSGIVYEAGVKNDLFGGALNTSLALYRSILRGQPQRDLTHPGFYVAIGEQQTEGIEVEAMGNIRPGWQIHAGYGLMLAETTEGPGAGQNFVRDFPKHTFRLWSKYDFMGRLDRLSVGGSLKGSSRMGTPPRDQAAYAAVDTQIGFALTPKLTFAFTVNNVLDRRYFQTVGTRTVYYGEPRQVVLQLRASL